VLFRSYSSRWHALTAFHGVLAELDDESLAVDHVTAHGLESQRRRRRYRAAPVEDWQTVPIQEPMSAESVSCSAATRSPAFPSSRVARLVGVFSYSGWVTDASDRQVWCDVDAEGTWVLEYCNCKVLDVAWVKATRRREINHGNCRLSYQDRCRYR
jgi:hypothetical protein